MDAQQTFGAACAIATPFDGSGALAGDRLAQHAAWLFGRGIRSIALFGTTGEGASVTLAERGAARDALSEAGVPMARVIEGVIVNAVDDAVVTARIALQDGVQGLLVPPPAYYKGIDQDGVFAWYADFIDKLGGHARDVILYHIPSQTAVPVAVETVGRLREAFPGVITGVKDSSGDFGSTRAFLRAHGDLAILVGHEGYLAEAVREGAQGTISGLANLVPEFVARLARGEPDGRADRFVQAIDRYPVMAAIKSLLAHRFGDESWARPRPPLTALGPKARAEITHVFDEMFAEQVTE